MNIKIQNLYYILSHVEFVNYWQLYIFLLFINYPTNLHPPVLYNFPAGYFYLSSVLNSHFSPRRLFSHCWPSEKAGKSVPAMTHCDLFSGALYWTPIGHRCIQMLTQPMWTTFRMDSELLVSFIFIVLYHFIY